MMASDGELKGGRLFVILGMHRSGTSALCRCLLTMGVDLGSNLNPPHETNPKGFWEDLNILELNENLLAALGMRWDSFSLLSLKRVQLIHTSELINQARDLVKSKIRVSDNKLFGFKEPRTAKLLSFWKKVFQGESYQVAYLLPYRNPLSAAQSLKKRDGFELTKCYLLWLLHVVPCLAETIGLQRLLVNYDDLLEDPVGVVSAVAKKFELSVDDALLHEYATDFLDKKLRHTSNTIEDLRLDSACPELVRKVYSFLEEVRLGKLQLDSESSELKIKEFVVELQCMAPTLELLDTKYQQNIDLQKNLADQVAEINRLHGLIANQCEQREALDVKLITVEQQRQSLQNDFVVADERSRNIKDHLLNAELEIVKLKRNLTQETHALQIAKSELIDASQKIELVSQRYEKVEEQQCHIIRQLELASEAIATHNQAISQIVQSNQQLQTELASIVRLLQSKSWSLRFFVSLKTLFFRQATGEVDNINLYNLPSDFDPVMYLKLNPDVARVGFDPHKHYVLHGISEGRRYKITG